MIFELVVTVFFILAVYSFTSRRKTKKLNLPPGPKPYPIIGNLTELLGPKRHLALDKLAKEHGKIYSLVLPGGQHCVVVNTAELAREALLTRKDEFSGRPYTFVGDYLTRNTADIICADFTPTMVRLRKIAHSALKMYGSGLQRLEDKITFEVDDLARRFIAHDGIPVDPKYDVSVAVLNVICSLVYGHRYDVNDPEFKRIVEYQDIFAEIFGSFNLLDLFPLLRFIPYEDNRRLHHARDIRDSIINREYRDHKDKFEIENVNANFQIADLTDALLQAWTDEKNEAGLKYDAEPLTEENVMMTMNDVFNAGFETTATSVLWLLNLMVNFPDVQARIQRDLDETIGSGRLPHLKDRHLIPYLEATIAEAQRFRTLVPISLPHKSTCDTTLAGYDIPEGTMFIPNLWSIHHNADDWKNPDEFNPERFLDSDGKFTAAGGRSFLPFGAGRRGCLGQSLAKTELYLMFSRLLHQFEFKKSPQDPLPTMEGTTGVVVHPGPFKMVVKERA